MLSVKASAFQRNFFQHPLLMTRSTMDTNTQCPQKGLTEVDGIKVTEHSFAGGQRQLA